jgi:serine/threonine protein kinase
MEDLTGKQFGPYQIVAPLGEGGMAAVYKAYQPSMERYVAVKVLPRQLAESAEFIARFKREAHLLAQLQHPHILPVFDYGQAEGFTYIVMPFIQSGTLADVMKTRQMSLTEIRRIITQVGDALGYAHARGMIHRDVKPSNVLVDERGNCLLTDFGLARMTEATSGKLTSSGAIMGTPAYMSPEQGAGSPLDGRSDIYSLGIIMYEMITGQVPYSAETPIAIVFKHIQDPLPAVRKLVPDLPEEIELVLIKSLAKKPADRYQNAEDFVQAVQTAIPANPAVGASKPVPEAPQTLVAAPPVRPAVSTPPVPVVWQKPPAAPPSTSYDRYNAPPPVQPSYRPVSQPPTPAPKQKNNSLWALAIIGVIVVCGVGALAIILGFSYFATPAPTVTPTQAPSTATSTLPAATVPAAAGSTDTPPPPPPPLLPPTVAPPPGVKFARINGITLNPQKQYVVDFETFEFKSSSAGLHVHFFFDTVHLEDAGMPGKGPWNMYPGGSPFTGYGTINRPKEASLLCILVAHVDHSVLPMSGNCYPLPDVPTATARQNTACLDRPTETGQLISTFRAGMSTRLRGFSADKTWLSIQNPERDSPESNTPCWVPFESSVLNGDNSQLPVINP